LAILVILLTISTLVLRYGVTKYSFADAFLRSVSVMATAAGFSEADYPDAPIVRVFVSILRIVGAILLAALTAIMTNYLVRAGLGGVFELRRVPEEGHIVVCGLSPVGFRVVEELMQQGERVVVIDQDPTQRFLATVRRLGAVVVIGDASLLEVLKQANTHTAKAIVAATNNDMTNLEVALLVREQNSDVRVVLLLNDPQFAQMLRDAAGIRLAVSVPALAAPAFLAGLFGDRVVSVFLLHDQLYAVLDLVIQAQDPFVGQTLRSISIDYRMRPLLHLQNDKQLSGERLIDRVGVGDRVLAMLSLSDMERLSRRQPCSAEYSVEVRSFPITSRAYLLGIVRMVQDSNQSEAEQWLKELPGTLQEGLTRGQAEELLGQLQRERVVAHMVRLNTEDANAPAAAN
jgi:Trk K+ transport system NAD-binding subunit